MAFIDVLTEARARLSDLGRERLAPLFVEDRLSRLTRQLDQLTKDGENGGGSRAVINGEATPALVEHALPLLDAFRLASSGERESFAVAVSKTAEALEAMQTSTLLLLLGQRVTKDSITDERAYPPSLQQLLATAAKTTGVDFGTNWLLRQRVFDSAHELTIQHYRRKHRIADFLWWALLGCGKRNYLLLFWGIAFVLLFAGLTSPCWFRQHMFFSPIEARPPF